MTIPSAAQQACPARQVCGLTRDCFVQFVRRLTTKELVFLRFVAPRNAGVNAKMEWNRRKNAASPMLGPLALSSPGSVRRFSCFRLVKNLPYHAAECGWAVRFLLVARVGGGRRYVFRILRIPAGKQNRKARAQGCYFLL